MSLVINVALASKDRTKQYTWKDVGAKSISTVISGYSDPLENSKEDLSAVSNSLQNVFMFRRGERILLPDFGNTVYGYVGKTINDSTKILINNELRNMLEWERRINITNVSVVGYPDDNQIELSVEYNVPSVEKGKNYSTSLTLTNNGVIV